MKKIFSLIFLLCLIMGVMLVASSCGDSDNTDGTGSSTADCVGTQSSKDNDTNGSSTTDATDTDNSAADSSNADSSTTDSGNVDSSTGDSSTTDSSTTDSSNDGTNPDVPSEPKTIKYIVRAVDAFGNAPEVSVVVEMFKDGESVGEMPIRRGSAAFQLEAGEYTFEVKPMEGEFYYDKAKCVLTEDEPEMTVTLYNYANEDDKQQLFVPDDTGLDHIPYDAVQVDEGATYVNIDRAAGTYFVFTPTRGGIYRISYESSRAVTLGYYGSPHNVLSTCPLEVVDGAFELEVRNEGVNIGNLGGTTQVVIGIRSFTVKGCVLKIERIGNATVELPWTDVQADKNATKADNFVNSEFVDFDVTDENLTVVYNENDGYYHLNTVDGPIIYIRISNAVVESVTSTETIYKYLPSFLAMCETARLCKVFYDDDGNIILKESYNDMLMQYGSLCGSGGMYPLNRQLAEAVKNIGEYSGWYDLESELHIFGDDAVNVVPENAWLFACVYENQMAKGTEEKPASVTPSTADSVAANAILVGKDEPVFLRTIAKAQLTINNAQSIKVVANDGTEYSADSETGVISVIVTANQSFSIEYMGEDATTVVYFTFVEYFE